MIIPLGPIFVYFFPRWPVVKCRQFSKNQIRTHVSRIETAVHIQDEDRQVQMEISVFTRLCMLRPNIPLDRHVKSVFVMFLVHHRRDERSQDQSRQNIVICTYSGFH